MNLCLGPSRRTCPQVSQNFARVLSFRFTGGSTLSALTPQRPPFVTLALGLFISWAETTQIRLCFVCGFQTQIMRAPLENNLFLEFRRPEDKDPVVVLALGFGLCSQPIENSRSKDKAPAVVFIGGGQP